MPDDSERLKILEMINSGRISVEEGLSLLNALDHSDGDSSEIETLPSLENLQPLEDSTAPPPPDFPEPHAPQIPGPEAVKVSAWDEPAAGIPAGEPPSPVVIVPAPSGGGGAGGSGPAGEHIPPHTPVMPSEVERWRRWWAIPAAAGAALVVLGALLMFLAWRAWDFSLGFVCAWVPFLVGVAVMGFALLSRRMRWLHLRVSSDRGDRPRRIAISMPLPIRFIRWGIRFANSRSAAMREHNVDEMVQILENLRPDQPFHMQVHDDDDGENVEIFIG
jgi:hypothetical protein